jgi:hypothetical protein
MLAGSWETCKKARAAYSLARLHVLKTKETEPKRRHLQKQARMPVYRIFPMKHRHVKIEEYH